MGFRVYHVDRDFMPFPLIKGGGDARMVMGASTGATTRTMGYVVMKPGQENVPHRHPASEDIIYILQGHGTAVDLDTGQAHPYTPGSVVLVHVGTRHAVTSAGPEDYISIGGPCPPDRHMLAKPQA